MKQPISALFLMILLSCGVSGEQALQVNAYFDLDSLLDDQIEQLSKSSLKLSKTVRLDEDIERQLLDTDSFLLEDEFKILREFDLNKSDYVGAYTISKTQDLIRYDLKEEESSPVQYLEIQLSQDKVQRVSGQFFEDRNLYQHQRTIDLYFNGNMINRYNISGFQKMVMKDTIRFMIEAELLDTP